MFSIIIPVYNVEKYLKYCVDSILAQTYRDFEIILINDGSTDSSGEICESYKKNNHYVKVIHRKNGGLSTARNTGIMHAEGEYVMFIDSDDWISNQTLEYAHNYIQEFNPDVIIFNIIKTSKEGINKAIGRPDVEYISSEEACIRMYGKDNINYVSACNKVVKRNLLKNNLFPVGKYYEDWYSTFKILYHAKNIIHVKKCFYYYRMRLGSITRSNNENYLDYIFGIYYGIQFFRKKNETIIVSHAIPYLLEYSLKAYCEKLTGKKKNIVYRICLKEVKSFSESEKITNQKKLKFLFFLIAPYLFRYLYNSES